MSPVAINDERLYRFAVKIAGDQDGRDTFLGTGFIAAPGFVLTCAHVVDGLADGTTVEVISTMPQIQDARAVIRARCPPHAGPAGLWDFPDLAIIELLDADGRRLSGHPCPRVDLASHSPQLPTRHRAIVAARLQPSDPRSDAHLRGLDFVWETVDDHGFWWLRDGHALRGMSGGMLLDTEHRSIVGVVNNSRGTSAHVGALATPLSALSTSHLPHDGMASAATELIRAVRDTAAHTGAQWDRAFTYRGHFEWRDHWHPDTGGNHFVGRHNELAKLESALDESEGVAVVRSIGGFGGIGKTALAVAFGERFRDRFPDGRVFHDFRSYRGGRRDSATDALGSLLTAIGAVKVDEVSKLSHRERQDRWRNAIAGRRLLMVWDNVDSADQLDGLLERSEGCAIIVTSRDTVLGSANDLRLDVLDEADAINMFRQIAGDDYPADLVTELVRRDLYVPVLIHTHATEIASAESILEEIIEDLPETSTARHDSDPDRQKDLFERLEGSYRRLDVNVQFAFRALGAHPGYRATIGSLAAAMDCGLKETRNRMSALVRAGLANRDTSDGNPDLELRTIRAHDLLRAFGAHLAEGEPAVLGDGSAGTELERTHAVLADYYFAHLGGPTASNERYWFSIEVDSIRDLVLAHHGERYGHLARFLGYRGNVFSRYDAAEAGFLHAKQIDERRGDTARTAHCLWGLGEVARSRNHLDLARQYYGAALELSRHAKDPGGIGNAERGLAEIAQLRGDAEAAESHYNAAMKVYQIAGNTHRIIYLRRGLARVAELKGDLDTARDLFNTALAGSHAEGDAVGIASAQRGLADVALAVGDLDEAHERYCACDAGFGDAGEPVSAARAVRGLGMVVLARGDRVAARAHFERAQGVFDEYDATIWLEQVQSDLADLDRPRLWGPVIHEGE